MSEASEHTNPKFHAGEDPDDVLVSKAQSGDKDAFETLVQRHSSRVYARAYSIVRDEDLALDMAQTAWVKAWQRIGQFESQSRFSTWMTRVTINVCLDFLRKSKRWRFDQSIEAMLETEKGPDLRLPVVEYDPLEGLERQELSQLVDQAMQALSADHRSVLVMHTYEQLSYAEMAELMNCSIGTIMSRLFYARKHLASILEPMMQKRNQTHES